MARRRFRKAGFDQKIIMDVGLAGIAVRIVPMLLNKFVPLDPTLYTVAGAGGGYLVGTFLKKPVVSNASIALGVVEFIAPMIEDIIGGIPSTPALVQGGGAQPGILGPPVVAPGGTRVKDYHRLNDYMPYPRARYANEYWSSY
jgi:hypothetical protein